MVPSLERGLRGKKIPGRETSYGRLTVGAALDAEPRQLCWIGPRRAGQRVRIRDDAREAAESVARLHKREYS